MRELLVYLTHLGVGDMVGILGNKLGGDLFSLFPGRPNLWSDRKAVGWLGMGLERPQLVVLGHWKHQWSYECAFHQFSNLGLIVATDEETEKRFLVSVIKDLLSLVEMKRGKDNKGIMHALKLGFCYTHCFQPSLRPTSCTLSANTHDS